MRRSVSAAVAIAAVVAAVSADPRAAQEGNGVPAGRQGGARGGAGGRGGGGGTSHYPTAEQWAAMGPRAKEYVEKARALAGNDPDLQFDFGIFCAAGGGASNEERANLNVPNSEPKLRAAFDKLTAPDFQLINPAGAALSRDEFLGGVDAGVIDFLALDPTSPIAVRLSGDSATLRYQTAFDLVVAGTHLTHEAWTTALYERRNGRWQIVWGQTTAIPNRPDLFIESIKPVG